MIEKMENKYEKGTLGWVRKQQNKKLDNKNKIIERWERCGIQNIFKDKGFSNEDRENWYRFWNKVDIKDNIDHCWSYDFDSYGKYGRFYLDSFTTVGSHRMSYMLSKGDIADKLQVQHSCNNPLCCNPRHL